MREEMRSDIALVQATPEDDSVSAEDGVDSQERRDGTHSAERPTDSERSDGDPPLPLVAKSRGQRRAP